MLYESEVKAAVHKQRKAQQPETRFKTAMLCNIEQKSFHPK